MQERGRTRPRHPQQEEAWRGNGQSRPNSPAGAPTGYTHLGAQPGAWKPVGGNPQRSAYCDRGHHRERWGVNADKADPPRPGTHSLIPTKGHMVELDLHLLFTPYDCVSSSPWGISPGWPHHHQHTLCTFPFLCISAPSLCQDKP